MNNIKIKFYEAFWGDSFLIEFNNDKRTTFLIDCGTKYGFVENIAEDLNQKFFRNKNNYIFLTHIDDDHIGGMQYCFEKRLDLVSQVNGVVFNTYESLKRLTPHLESTPYIYINDNKSGYTSYNQGVKLEQRLCELGIKVISNLKSKDEIHIDDIKITFLSPSFDNMQKYKTWADKKQVAYTASVTDYKDSLELLKDKAFFEDESITNGSSLSMLIEYENVKMLFLGDSLPSDIVKTLNSLGYSKENKLKLDVVKVSHHGSKHNTSSELLGSIICGKYLISTNGLCYGHPDKETLARIIYLQDCPELIFNYDVYNRIFFKEEIESGLFTVHLLGEVTL